MCIVERSLCLVESRTYQTFLMHFDMMQFFSPKFFYPTVVIVEVIFRVRFNYHVGFGKADQNLWDDQFVVTKK